MADRFLIQNSRLKYCFRKELQRLILFRSAHTASAGGCLYTSSKKLYEQHVPTTPVQKLLLTLGSASVAFKNPYRHDMVAVLGETTGYLAAKRMRKMMLEDPVGQQILRERPVISSSTVDLDYLRSLPEDTFGRAYIKFLDGHKVTPDSRYPVKFVDDEEIAYVITRYRQIHDFVHTLAGMGIGVTDEIAVKWFEMVQTRLPMTALAAIFVPITLSPRKRQLLRTKLIPWALYCGNSAKFVMNVYYEKHFEEPLDKLRKDLNMIPAPKVKKSQNKTVHKKS